MTDKVFLHIGPPKTASTFLQLVLDKNQEILRERGIYIPEPGPQSHAKAALEAMRRRLADARVRGRWKILVDEVATWNGPTTLITTELMASADQDSVDRIVKSLEPAEVHVIFMARDLSKVIPGMWQTLMRNTFTVPWKAYLASLRGDKDAPRQFGGRFWKTHDPREALARWERHVPRDHIHVVTVPPSGTDPSVLWSRFCEVLEIDPSGVSLDVSRSNESLGSAEAELLRRVNAKVVKRIPRDEYDRWVKIFVARKVLEKRDSKRRIALPEEEHAWLRPRAEAISEFLETHGYQLVGDTSDILPAPVSSSAYAPDDVDVEEVLDAAVDVIAGLVRRNARNDRRGRATGGGPAAPATSRPRVTVARARAAIGRRTGLPARLRRRR